MGEDAESSATTTSPVKIAEGREAEIFSWSEHEVLRLYRDPTASATADRELLALGAVRASLTCVPAPRGRIEWMGRPGILMERLEGHGIFAEIQRRPWRVWALATLTGRVHAGLSGIDAPGELPDLRGELGRRIETGDSIASDLRIAALEELNRLPDGPALCHGDFHPDNVLLCSTGPVVIDWSSATRGDPCGDFARSALMLRVGALPPGAPPLIRWVQSAGRGLFARAYLGGYESLRTYDEETARRWRFVRAVDRLADRIPEERQPLLHEAARLLQCLRRC
jgi:aminoglycoside phosphotransferase (APT) family kinase protein